MANDNFDEFYKDLKETEKADSKLTPKQQIDRLLRPGSTYRNLNPYDVLQVDPELPFEDVKKNGFSNIEDFKLTYDNNAKFGNYLVYKLISC